MIPVFAAWKAASPLIKYGAIAGVIVLAWGWYVGQRAYHEWQGRLQAEATQERELREQAQESAKEAVRQRDQLLQKVEEIAQEKETFRAQLTVANQEIQRYARLHKVRRIDPDAIAIVNEFARVLNDATADERVSGASGTPTEPPVAAKTGPTTLDAFERLEELTERLGDCEIKHRGLSEWAIEKYQTEWRFYQGLHNDEVTP